MTLAKAQEYLDAIEQAIGSGELTVTFSDRSTMYRSMDDLFKARKYWADKVAVLSGTTVTTTRVGYSNKGLD